MYVHLATSAYMPNSRWQKLRQLILDKIALHEDYRLEKQLDQRSIKVVVTKHCRYAGRNEWD